MNRHSPIGLDIGPRHIHAAQLDGSRLSLLASASIARTSPGSPFDGAEAARLESVLYRAGFEGHECVIGVPDDQLVTSVLELPPRSSGAPIEQLARLELARVHKLDPGAFEMASWDLPAPARAGDASHIMAAACANAPANTLLDAVESAGLSVLSLDIRPWALTRACERLIKADASAVLLDIAEHGALLTAVRGGVPVYERTMRESGMTSLRDRVAKAMSIEPGVADFLLSSLERPSEDGEARDVALRIAREHVDQLQLEVRSALEYVVHRYPEPVTWLGLSGPGALLPGVVQCLERGLECRVMRLTPRELLPTVQAEADNSGLITALGLALYPVRRAA